MVLAIGAKPIERAPMAISDESVCLEHRHSPVPVVDSSRSFDPFERVRSTYRTKISPLRGPPMSRSVGFLAALDSSRVLSDRIILELCRRFPADATIFQPSHGRPEAEYARMSAEPFLGLFGLALADLRGKCVLDLGSGFGSQAVHYAEAGAGQVIGLEIEEDKVLHSRAFAESKGVADIVSFVAGAGEQLPFASNSFDLITMHDVMEHVVTPELVLRECFRCLKPGGSLLMVFPPYYCVVGGPHLGGYATRLPGLNLLFSSRRLKSAITIYLEESGHPWRSFLREVPSDKLWNLNGLTIGGLHRLLDRLPFEADIWFMGLRDRRKPSPRRPLPALVFAAFETSAKVPLVREAMCSRVVAGLTKPDTAS